MRITRSADRACRPLACPGGYYKPLDGYGSWISLTATPRRPRIKRSAGRAYRPPADRVDGNHFMVSWITGITELPLPDHAMYILHVVQPADITLQGFLFAAQFLTANSRGRFFNRTATACCSVLRVNAPVQPRRPSTLTLVLIRRWTHLIPPLTPHSPFVPATSCPDPNIDPQVDQAYFAPHPPPPPPSPPWF